MRKKFLQLEKTIRILCGIAVFPISLILLMFKEGINDYNFTGLLNKPETAFFVKTAALIMMMWCMRTVWIIDHKHHAEHSRMYRWMLLFSFCTIVAVMTPYIEGSWHASIHLFFSYSAMLVFNLILYLLMDAYSTERLIYYAGTAFCVLLCFTSLQITGLAELIYACMVSVLLTVMSI